MSSTVVPPATSPRTTSHTSLRLRGSCPVVGSSRKSTSRAHDEAGREVEPAAHPARVRLRLAVGGLGQPELVEQLVARARARRARDEVEQPAEQLEVLAPGEHLVDRVVLAGEPDPVADLGGVARDVEAGDPRAPGVGAQQRAEDPHRRRLARAVRAEQPADAALRHLEVQRRPARA